MWCCSRYNHEYEFRETRPYTNRDMYHRQLRYKGPPKTHRILRDYSPASRVGHIWSKRNSRSRFRPNTKPTYFAYQIRQRVVAWQKWHDEFVSSLVRVQPMTAPTGLIYTMKVRYSSNAS